MLKQKHKKLTALLLICLAAVLITVGVLTIGSVKAHGFEIAEEERVDMLEQNQAETQAKTTVLMHKGLGLGINVITAESVNEFKSSYNILDSVKLADMLENHTFRKTPSIPSSLVTLRTIDIDELRESFEVSASTGSSANFFLGSVSANLKATSNFDYSNYNSKYYYACIQNFYKYTEYFENYGNPEIYQSNYSSNYLKDLSALSKGTMTYKDFFDRYGTHLVASATYGGKLRANYTIASNNIGIGVGMKTAIDASLSGTLSGTTEDKVAAAIQAQLGTNYTIQQIKSYLHTNFKVIQIGGATYIGTGMDNFEQAKKEWAQSFSGSNYDESYCHAVDYEKGGLIGLWEILPAQYASLSSKMEQQFNTLISQQGSKFEEEFKTNNYTDFNGGIGSKENPYRIKNATQLSNIYKDLSASYILETDIDLSGIQWNPIGDCYAEVAFTGELDGNNHKILNFTRTNKIVEKGNRFYFGLFGWIDGGKVSNITFEKVAVKITGPKGGTAGDRLFFGVLAGRVTSHSQISDIKVVSGNFTYDCCTPGRAYAGGVVGHLRDSEISKCSNSIAITCGRYSSTTGGVVAYAYHSTVRSCTNSGTLYGLATRFGGYIAVGGIVGQAFKDTSLPSLNSTVTNCSNTGTLKYKGYGSIGRSYSSIVDDIVGEYLNADYK